jgi:hypothetical protein
MMHYDQNPDGVTGNRSSSRVHRSILNTISLPVWRDVTEMAKALTPKNSYGSGPGGNENPSKWFVMSLPWYNGPMHDRISKNALSTDMSILLPGKHREGTATHQNQG